MNEKLKIIKHSQLSGKIKNSGLNFNVKKMDFDFRKKNYGFL